MRSRRRPLLVAGLHLGVLWAFAFQKPLFDLLGRNADFFVARGNTREDILAFAILFTLVPPLAMVGFAWLVGRIARILTNPPAPARAAEEAAGPTTTPAARPAEEAVVVMLVGLLGAAIVLQFLKDNVATGPAAVLILAALTSGGLLAYAYFRSAVAPQALTILSPAPALFLLLFLFFSPVEKLILPQGAAEAAKVKISDRTPVVMVVFDELPVTSLMGADERIDAARYPNFAELARSSTWYRNTTTVASYTTRATPAVLTGEDPRGRLPIAADHHHSLFTLLGRSYRMNVNETATSVCPAKLCGGRDLERGSLKNRPRERFRARMRQLVSDLRIVSAHLLLPEGVARSLPPVDQTFGGFGEAETEDDGGGGVAVQQLNETVKPGAFTNRDATFARFVRSLKNRPRTLNLLHTELPHVPWVYLPGGQSYETHSPDLPLRHGQWASSQAAVDYAHLRHLLQVGFTDKLLGDLISRMKRVGLWEKAVLVVTSDHGLSFLAGKQRRDPRLDTVGGIAHVPLFVRSPGQRRQKVDDSHKCTTDVLGMVAAELRVDVPWPGHRCPAEIRIAKFDGNPLRLPLTELLAKRRATLSRMLELFGSGAWPRAYRFGPHGDLIGKPVSEVPQATPLADRVALENDFESVDPALPRVPVIAQGPVSGVPPGTPVAVAVNGRIAATGETFEWLDAVRVAATFPPTSLRAGSNSIEVFRILGGRLQSLGGVNLQ